MITSTPSFSSVVASAFVYVIGGISSLSAATTLTQQISPPEVNLGDRVIVTFTLQGNSDSDFALPAVDGLLLIGNSSATTVTFDNGALKSAVIRAFVLIPQRAGEFTIPAFDFTTGAGEVIHAKAMKLNVLAANAPAPANPAVPQGNGPVVMPPATANAPNAPSDDASAPEIRPPIDSDGRPAKVFMVITAQTADAYVGETIPLRIEFYRRADASADQNALPTIQGSDFLMNNLSYRPAQDALEVMGEPYYRETWMTAISASHSGDYPLTLVRDSYWIKNPNPINDPIANLFGRTSNLAHSNISSNPITIHARPLPTEGRPAGFTGAIGQFTATAVPSAQSGRVGDPLYLNFSISGQGNFDSVHCPVLAPDPHWKSYSATAEVHYQDQSRTQGMKTFQQAIIPRMNGMLPFPSASFSYFDPAQKKYVTIPISLPQINVTGTPQPDDVSPPASVNAPASVAAPSASTGLEANRLDPGALHSSLAPVYRQPWFWISQAVLILLALLAALVWLFLRPGRRFSTRNETALRQRSLQDLTAAMSTAAQQGDAPAFFLAARRAVQLHWGAQWHLAPDAVTLPQISERDPQLAEIAAPLFHQADEVMYSGLSSSNLDLADWERHVREDLLHPQAARVS